MTGNSSGRVVITFGLCLGAVAVGVGLTVIGGRAFARNDPRYFLLIPGVLIAVSGGVAVACRFHRDREVLSESAVASWCMLLPLGIVTVPVAVLCFSALLLAQSFAFCFGAAWLIYVIVDVADWRSIAEMWKWIIWPELTDPGSWTYIVTNMLCFLIAFGLLPLGYVAAYHGIARFAVACFPTKANQHHTRVAVGVFIPILMILSPYVLLGLIPEAFGGSAGCRHILFGTTPFGCVVRAIALIGSSAWVGASVARGVIAGGRQAGVADLTDAARPEASQGNGGGEAS